ncbi:MAG TPA: hypothetical protein PLS00_10010 [Niabella sp.]|nr:hypothetical protein [Niabella sp.]
MPPALREYASLQKDLVMTSLGNKMEIWDSNKYKQFFDSFSPEAFNDLASIVMGGS